MLSFSLAACGDDDSAGPETGTDVEDVTEDDYFASNRFLGDRVTVSAEVTDVLSPKSFVINGDDWGDDSLLALSGKDVQNVNEGGVVQVTGTVQQFTYDTYADPYGLVEPGVYDPYGNEEFLEATNVDPTIDGASPTS